MEARQPTRERTVLVLDLGGVVFHYDHQSRLRRLSQLCGVPTKELDEMFWQSGFADACDNGRIGTADDVRREIRTRLTWEGTDEALDEAWCSALTPHDSVVHLLAGRAQPGPRLATFTNNGPLEELTFPRLHAEVFALFDDAFYSHSLGATKPDRRAYVAVTNRLGVAPERIAFFDDNRDNVEGARRFGWQASVFESPDDLAPLVGPG